MFPRPSMLCNYITDLRGVVAVESAIIMPFLAALSLGAIDASYMLLQNHKMEQALVSAANYLSLAEDPRLVETQAKQIAISGTVDPNAPPLIKNWTIEDVSITYKMIANNNGVYRGGEFIRVVDIRSSHPYSGFGLIKAITGNAITLNAQYEQRMTGTTI